MIVYGQRVVENFTRFPSGSVAGCSLGCIGEVLWFCGIFSRTRKKRDAPSRRAPSRLVALRLAGRPPSRPPLADTQQGQFRVAQHPLAAGLIPTPGPAAPGLPTYPPCRLAAPAGKRGLTPGVDSPRYPVSHRFAPWISRRPALCCALRAHQRAGIEP
jgi:hypothetical protein